MASMGGWSIKDFIMDGLPKAARQGVSLMIAGGIMVTAFFTFLAQPMANMQTKVDRHDEALQQHQKVLDQQNNKIDKVVDAVNSLLTTEQVHAEALKNINDNQARQENTLGKIGDKIDKVLERVR